MDVAAFLDDLGDPREAHDTTDVDHGRVEICKLETSGDAGWFLSDRRDADGPHLPGLAASVPITSRRGHRHLVPRRLRADGRHPPRRSHRRSHAMALRSTAAPLT